jgi:hypothetical protein
VAHAPPPARVACGTYQQRAGGQHLASIVRSAHGQGGQHKAHGPGHVGMTDGCLLCCLLCCAVQEKHLKEDLRKLLPHDEKPVEKPAEAALRMRM